MNVWWESLNIVLKVLYCIAIPSTLVLILQTIFSFAGFADGGDVNISDTSGFEADVDFDVDIDTDIDVDFNTDVDISADMTDISGHVVPNYDSLRLLSVQGLLAFFAVFSWMSIALMSVNVPVIGAVVIGILAGVAAMYGVAVLVKSMKGLAENGTVNFKNAIGENAVVYMPIPANAKGEGKVTLTFQGRFMECTAITHDDTMLTTGQSVRVTDLRGEILVVEQDD